MKCLNSFNNVDLFAVYSSYVSAVPESPNRCEIGDGTVITCRRNLEINSKYSVTTKKSSSANVSREGVKFFGNVKTYDGESPSSLYNRYRSSRASSILDVRSKVQDM